MTSLRTRVPHRVGRVARTEPLLAAAETAATTAPDAHVLTAVDLARGAWTVVSVADLGHTPELLLESGATVHELRLSIGAHRVRLPGAALLVVVALDAPAELVVAAYEEGSDACVRGFDPPVVRAHLSAIYRRRQQSRISGT
jgi:hypothetical protein